MISQIEGIISEIGENFVVVNVQGLYYEVFVIKSLLQDLQNKKVGDKAHFIVYHYIQTDPSKSLPILIGFNNKVEKDFFIKFISVSGIGPKAAVRALSAPISEIARAIDQADVDFLRTLPGIGEQRAREIVAKLQGKVGRFGLIQDGEKPSAVSVPDDFKEDALSVLLQLQYKREEAKSMIHNALRANPQLRNAEELLNEIYRQHVHKESVRA